MIAIDDVLNAQEAAKLLGAHVETIRRMARKGKIPAFKVGKDWRFRQTSLLNWSETNPGISIKPNLLVIDDDDGVQKLMRRYFDPGKYSLITAFDGVEGLKLIQTEPVDIVLLDLAMPIMNGVSFLRKLRQNHPEIPVIIVTGHPDGKLMMEASQFGPLMLIPKPLEKKMLLAAVNLALNGVQADTGSLKTCG
jgi:excisionase family DNA binding protein